MGACQTQQNIDINLFINNGEVQTKKKYSIENKINQKKNINQIIKKAYMNNIEFNNTKKRIGNTYKFRLIKPKNKIPLRNKINKVIINNKDNKEIKKKGTNKLNLSYGGEKMPIDNTRSNSREKSKILNMSYNERMIDNSFINNKKEKNNILTDRNKSINTKSSEKNIKYINSKIIKDEDDTEKIISNLNEQIKKENKNKKDSLILSFDDFDNKNNKEELQLYYLTEFNFNSDNKYSKEKDFDDIIQSQIYKNKIDFTNLILSLPERKWYNEIIKLSDKFKYIRQKNNIDDCFLMEYLNKILKIYNHFNHLVWALAYFYSNSLFLKKNYWFKNDKINLPYYKSLEYIKGFEWKGLHIKILTYEQAKKLIREIKSLKCAFFDFLTLFNNNCKDNNLLSNEIIFPLMSYAYIGGIILYVSVEIKKFCYDSNYLKSNIIPKNDINKLDRLYKSLIRKSLRLSDKNEVYDCTIENSDDNFSFDEKILNEEINLSNYSKNDLNDTKILKKITEDNLLKIFDEFTDENKEDRKSKFILKNIYDLVPNLFNEDDKAIYKKLNILNCIDIKNEFKEPRFVNLTKVNNLDKKNEMNVLSKLIRINATKENIEIYKNKLDDIQYKIIFNNNKKGIKINEQITKYFVQFPLIQNYELSRLLITEYLNVGNLNGILNKYYKENTQEIPDRNIIIFRTKFQTKKKMPLINIIEDKENIFPKTNDEFISYVKQFSNELSLSTKKIINIDNLFSFCNKYGFNKKFLPFCLEYITDESISNIIQIYLFVSFIKKYYNYREGQTLLMKLALFERNKDDSIINSSEIIKSNNIIETQKKCFVDLIKLIFLPIEYLKDEKNTKDAFSKSFFENISFFIFLRILKIKNYEKYINFKSSLAQIEIKQILKNFIEISRNNSFLFFDTLERLLNIRINSFIKYKSSIDINNIKNIKKEDIVIFTPEIKSFIDISSISSYIFTILLKNNNNINNINPILSKINFGYFFPKLNFENPINYNKNNEIILNKKKYYIKNEEIMKTFCEILEQIFDGIISYNGDKELILSKSYIYLLLNSFFCCDDLKESKEYLITIKNNLLYQNIFSLSQNAILYLLEGFISYEDFSISEDYYLKSFFLFLLNQGDIRNKNNKINPILIFPIFQLIRIINKNPNQYLNDYLNEIFFILNNKLENNINEFIKKLKTNSEINKKDFIFDNNTKYFICNTIIKYFYSKDNLLFNEDILSLFKIKLNNNEFIKRKNNRIIEYLFDEMSYTKNAPNNLVIIFGKINNKISKPKVIYSLLDKKIKKIFSGYESNFLIDEKNIIYSFGNNDNGQLGIKYDLNNIFIDENNPKEIKINELENNEYIKDIYCAEKFSFFLSNKNRIYITNKISEPKKLNYFFEKEKIIKISIGDNFCLFLTGWGNVYNIDYNENNSEIINDKINKVPNLNNIQKIFCGYKHCFAIAKNNIIFCWGNNYRGQLGLNDNSEHVLIPKKLVLNYDEEADIDNIFCGKDFSIFHNTKKEIFVCGNNEEGQLGIKKEAYLYKYKNEDCLIPVLNEQFYNLQIIKLCCGEVFCLAMIKDSITKIINIWTWGRNREGQLGLDLDIENSRPKLVPNLLEYINHNPLDIACGKNHSLILLEKKDEIINIDNDKILEQIISKYNKF